MVCKMQAVAILSLHRLSLIIIFVKKTLLLFWLLGIHDYMFIGDNANASMEVMVSLDVAMDLVTWYGRTDFFGNDESTACGCTVPEQSDDKRAAIS